MTQEEQFHRPESKPRIQPILLLFIALCSLALSGCGGVVVAANANASLTIDTQRVSFGNVALNTSSTQAIILVSSGSAPVTITGLKLTGAGFSIPGFVAPRTLPPGQTLTLYVQFVPTASGNVVGQLTLTTNSKSTPVLEIALIGGTGGSGYQVNLTWNPPSNPSTAVAGYQVYRSRSGDSQYLLLSGSPTAPANFMDTDVESGVTYDYYVTTIDAQGAQSAPSNTAEVAVP